MNGTHQVFAYVDYINLIGDDIRTIERNADVLLNVGSLSPILEPQGSTISYPVNTFCVIPQKTTNI